MPITTSPLAPTALPLPATLPALPATPTRARTVPQLALPLDGLTVAHANVAAQRAAAAVTDAVGRRTLDMLSLFSGVEAFGYGMRATHKVVQFCEKEPSAQRVLRARHPGVRLDADVELLDTLHVDAHLLVAGFPCTDASKAQRKRLGVFGESTGLVKQVFRLLATKAIANVVLENVTDVLTLSGGIGIRYIVRELERLGYTRWAYRCVDSRYFGTVQRRQRFYLVASRPDLPNACDPREVLLVDDQPEDPRFDTQTVDLDALSGLGFYYTEGKHGVGWAPEGLPPLKASNTKPAILLADGRIVVPHLHDAERAQALPVGWTAPGGSETARWSLVGNAVTSTIPQWIAARMEQPTPYAAGRLDLPFVERAGRGWPKAAWSMGDGAHVARVGENPLGIARPKIADWLAYEPTLLSAKGTAGFLARAEQSALRFPPGFLARVRAHLARMRDAENGGQSTLALAL